MTQSSATHFHFKWTNITCSALRKFPRNVLHVTRRFSHSVTNRFTHSTTNYRYQFKFLRSYAPTSPRWNPAKYRYPRIPTYTTLCNRVLLPIYCFPSTLPRKNRAEMPLNYTNPIEFATLLRCMWRHVQQRRSFLCHGYNIKSKRNLSWIIIMYLYDGRVIYCVTVTRNYCFMR